MDVANLVYPGALEQARRQAVLAGHVADCRWLRRRSLCASRSSIS